MRYNKKKEGTPTITTHQGGVGYQQSPEVALISLMATGLDKTYYEGSNEREKRLVDLVKQVAEKDKYFAAQCIVYARNILGQRTVTHRAAVELARHIQGEDWGKRFFGRGRLNSFNGGVITRLDDILEIAACYFHYNPGKNLSNPIKKGFAQVLHGCDEYELAKYRGQERGVSMIDIVNLVRPIPSSKNKDAFMKLMTGKLIQTSTSEALQSEAGRVVSEMVKAGAVTKEEGEEILIDTKAANWESIIPTAGYLNLLRNLANMARVNTDLIELAGKRLTNLNFIQKSVVFPHQIDLALEFLLNELSGPVRNRVVAILDEAYELSTINVRELGMDGATAVVIDTSASMTSSMCSAGTPGSRINSTAAEKAALIGATLAKGLGADCYQFADSSAEFNFNPNDSVNTIKKALMAKNGSVGHGTYIDTVFQLFNKLKRQYNRVFILSDLQIADSLVTKPGYYNAGGYADFVNRCGVPYIYAVDLKGYGNQPIKPGDHYFNLAGYSQQIYTTAKQYEVDPQALINEVKRIKI